MMSDPYPHIRHPMKRLHGLWPNHGIVWYGMVWYGMVWVVAAILYFSILLLGLWPNHHSADQTPHCEKVKFAFLAVGRGDCEPGVFRSASISWNNFIGCPFVMINHFWTTADFPTPVFIKYTHDHIFSETGVTQQALQVPTKIPSRKKLREFFIETCNFVGSI